MKTYIVSLFVGAILCQNAVVMRAVADANESSAMYKVNEQLSIAKKMKNLENIAKVNESINKAAKDEEKKVIDAANKRMSEVHLQKETRASAAAKTVAEHKKATAKAFKEADKGE